MFPELAGFPLFSIPNISHFPLVFLIVSLPGVSPALTVPPVLQTGLYYYLHSTEKISR